MLPTYEEGQLVLAVRPLRKLRVHDIVIMSHEGREKIKRITELSDDKVYVRGDNPRHSTDSRHFGWLETRHVKGRVIWPNSKRAK